MKESRKEIGLRGEKGSGKVLLAWYPGLEVVGTLCRSNLGPQFD